MARNCDLVLAASETLAFRDVGVFPKRTAVLKHAEVETSQLGWRKQMLQRKLTQAGVCLRMFQVSELRGNSGSCMWQRWLCACFSKSPWHSRRLHHEFWPSTGPVNQETRAACDDLAVPWQCRHVAMTEIYPSLAQCAVVAAALKILLFPA